MTLIAVFCIANVWLLWRDIRHNRNFNRNLHKMARELRERGNA